MDAEFLQNDLKEKLALPDQDESLADIDVIKLRDLLYKRLNEAELRSLCFGIVDFDNLPGEAIKNKIEAMISHFQRHEKFGILMDRIREERQDIALDEL